MFKRLTNKKGFTIIELIAVIAIIAILATVMVIVVNPGSQRRADMNGRAKTFYYGVQEVMAEQKLFREINIPAGQKMLLCVYQTETSIPIDDGSLVNATITNCPYVCAADLTTVTGFTHYITQSVSSDVNMALADVVGPEGTYTDGYFYAVIDSDYRVVTAFATDASLSELKAAAFTTDGTNSIDGHMIGTFPIENAESGQSVLS